MKVIMKRSVGIVLSLVLCICMVFVINLSVNATTVDYVKNGSYIYNWGTREEVANFLSPNAEAFYTKNNTTYAKLAALNGSHIESSVPSSALYIELQNLMKSNHTYINSYKKNNELLQYTDCQNSGGKISSFYSGNSIGPSWNGEWNKEHTWPNSKGDKAGSGEDDVMMIRPTASSENFGRGNKAYGKSSSYYNPNNESGGKYDLRGDVARIILYQYVRWNCTNTGSKYNPNGIYGTNGVIESRAVLLEWMEADPVDTWELGRNDSVESITGTRNVFVDYPELAFILFGEQVPSNYTTPSGEAKKIATTPPIQDNSSNLQTGNNSSTSNNNNSSQNTTTSKPSDNTTTSKPTISTPTNTTCKHINTQVVEAEEARCDAEGYTEGKYCNDCKTYISGRKLIESIGHTYSSDCDVDCNMCDFVRDTPTYHIYDDADICTLCGKSKDDTQNKGDSDTTIGAIDENKPSTDEATSEEGGFPWTIVIIVGVVLLAGGAVAAVLIIKKSKTNNQ